MKESKTSKKIEDNQHSNIILFDTKMRQIFVEGVLQNIKKIIESKSNGLVEVCYDDYDIGKYEFGFKLYATKTKNCKRQTFNEATSTIVNIVNYMFQGDNTQYDIAIFSEDDRLEVVFVSQW